MPLDLGWVQRVKVFSMRITFSPKCTERNCCFRLTNPPSMRDVPKLVRADPSRRNGRWLGLSEPSKYATRELLLEAVLTKSFTLQCIDLTTLAGDDTPSNVKRLCSKAKHPVHIETLKALGVDDGVITTGAVCVYPNMVATAGEVILGFILFFLSLCSEICTFRLIC